MKHFAVHTLLCVALSAVPSLAQDSAELLGADSTGAEDPGRTPADFQTASGEDYGTILHWAVIGAPDFRPLNSTTTWDYDGLGYLYRTGGATTFWAPVHLPTGVQIDQVCFLGYDSAATNLSFDFGVYELAGGGVPPVHANTVAPTTSSGWSGYGTSCPSITPHFFQTFGDLDGNSDYNPLVYRVVFDLAATDNSQRLGAVVLTWRRVSASYGVSSYTDVPVGHPYFHSVHALRAAGITAGCAANRFCPDHPVTRAQLALFFARALGLSWQ